MNLVFALGLLCAGGILMYAGVKGETLSAVMNDLNTLRTTGAPKSQPAGGKITTNAGGSTGAPQLIK